MLSVLLAVVLMQSDRPDPAKSEWLMKPTIGIEVCDYDEAVKLFKNTPFNVTKRKGVFITRVRPFSSADSQKLKGLDLITSVNGIDVETADDFTKAVESLKTKTDVFLSVKSVSVSAKGATWAAAKRVKLFTYENGRLARISVTIKRDQVTGIGVIHVRDNPLVADVTPLTLLFLIDQEGYAIRPTVAAHYSGKDWVFADGITIKTTDGVFHLKGEPDMANRSVSDKTGRVHEVVNFPFENEETRKAFVAAYCYEDPIVRFTGKNAPADIVLTPSQQWRMEILHDAYESMKYGDVFNLQDF